MKSRHAEVERELVDYFSGEHVGHMGLRSWLGPMLEHAQAATLGGPAAPAWNGHSHPPVQFVTVGKSAPYVSSGDGDIADKALAAVRMERIVRAALSSLSSEDQHALAAYYRPHPPEAPDGILAVAATRVGEARLRETMRIVATKPNKELGADALADALAQRAAAKAELKALEQAAKFAFGMALERYATASEDATKAERMARATQWARRCA